MIGIRFTQVLGGNTETLGAIKLHFHNGGETDMGFEVRNRGEVFIHREYRGISESGTRIPTTRFMSGQVH